MLEGKLTEQGIKQLVLWRFSSGFRFFSNYLKTFIEFPLVLWFCESEPSSPLPSFALIAPAEIQ